LKASSDGRWGPSWPSAMPYTRFGTGDFTEKGFKTFSEYCAEKWGMGKAYANRLIGGRQVAINLAPRDALCTACEIQPIYEKQVRPLAVLEPVQQCEVWEEAVRSADGKVVTFKQVKATVTELTAPAPEPNPPSASHSGFAYSGPPRRAPFTPPTPLTLGAPFHGRGGAVSGPQRRRFIVPGGRSGGASQVAGALCGKVRPGEGRRHPCRFLNPCCFRRQHRPAPHLCPWSESKTGTPRDSPSPKSM